MNLTHHPRTLSLVQTQRGRRDERGYILVTFALLLVPLLLIAGLSVDVGGWYSRASNMQKATDAAALAGVVWLPDVTDAQKYALIAASRNGFTNGVNGVTVVATQISDRRLQVVITDPNVGSTFFQALGGHKITLSRTALGEYVLPVPLGSPDNHFGNDPTDNTYTQPNLWGNIHGPYTDDTKGDAFAAGCQGSDNCSTQNNSEYRSSGYLYTITVPAGVSNMQVEVYDAGLYPRSAESVDTGDTAYTGTGSTTTVWTMYDIDNTPLDVTDNPTATSDGFCTMTGTSPASTTTFGNGTWTLAQGASASTYENTWQTLCGHNGTTPAGTYLLRVQTTGNGSAANRYSVKVLSSTSTKATIAGYGDMSMYNNISTGSSSQNVTANFYLADVSQINVGKTFKVSLYDPGEVTETTGTTGSGTIKVIMPSGSVASSCTGITDAPSSTFTSGSTLTPCQFTSAVNGTAEFNGYWVTLLIAIPTTYTCTDGTVPGCWWKIQYVINGQANDTTTWSAQVIGDPVHLVQPGT